MDFFGIGILEILAILLLMAVVFGPHRLPEIAGQAGRMVRTLREYARDFRDEYLVDFEEVKEEYLEVRHEIEDSRRAVRSEAKSLDTELRTAVTDAEQEATAAVKDVKQAVTGTQPQGPAPDAVPVPAPDAAPAPRRGAGQARRSPRGRTAGRPANVISINRSRQRRP